MSQKKKAFTLVELLVVISIIALLVSILMPALGKAKRSAQNVVCMSNLHQYSLAGTMYLMDNDDKYPNAWKSLYSEQKFDSSNTPYPNLPNEIQRFCRWHNKQYNLDSHPKYGGPLWPYLAAQEANLCPTFRNLGRSHGARHPGHVSSIGIDPINGYSMNAYLGDFKASSVKHAYKTFFFSEENMWTTPGRNGYVLNDNALVTGGTDLPPGTEQQFVDSFASFHHTSATRLDDGVANAVFVDGHVGEVHWTDSYRYSRVK